MLLQRSSLDKVVPDAVRGALADREEAEELDRLLLTYWRGGRAPLGPVGAHSGPRRVAGLLLMSTVDLAARAHSEGYTWSVYDQTAPFFFLATEQAASFVPPDALAFFKAGDVSWRARAFERSMADEGYIAEDDDFTPAAVAHALLGVLRGCAVVLPHEWDEGEEARIAAEARAASRKRDATYADRLDQEAERLSLRAKEARIRATSD